MNDVYTRDSREKKVIKLNSEFQAVADDPKVLSEFTNFLGTLARQSVPLDCMSWHKYPEDEKERLWNFVKVDTQFSLRMIVTDMHVNISDYFN